MTPEKFAKYLCTIRVGHSKALRWVATEIGIAPRELSDIEHDRAVPSPEVLRELEKVYYMSPNQLDAIAPNPWEYE